MLKKEYEIQLSMKEAKIADLNDKILKFKKLQP